MLNVWIVMFAMFGFLLGCIAMLTWRVRQMGSSNSHVNITVDACNASDPEAVEAAIRKALAKAAPHIMTAHNRWMPNKLR